MRMRQGYFLKIVSCTRVFVMQNNLAKLALPYHYQVEILWDYKMAFGDESYDNQSDGEGTLTRKRDFKHDEENNFKRDVQKEKLGKGN